MTVIQIGSFALMFKWLILGTSILLSLIFLKVWLHFYQVNNRKEIFDFVSGIVFVGFFIWKGSLFLLEPQLVIKSPLSLLYFTGGSKGLIITVTILIFYSIYKSKKIGMVLSVAIRLFLSFSFSVFGSYHLLISFFVDENAIYYFFVGIVALVSLGWILLMKRDIEIKHLFTLTILYSFYYIIVSIIILGPFAFEHWFFIGVIIVSLYFWDRKLD